MRKRLFVMILAVLLFGAAFSELAAAAAFPVQRVHGSRGISAIEIPVCGEPQEGAAIRPVLGQNCVSRKCWSLSGHIGAMP